MLNWLFTPSRPPYPLLDMHSHILPGIDDGAPDLSSSLELLRGLWQLGYRQFTATPHVMAELHPNTPATINAALNELNQALAATEDMHDLQLHAAAEYMLDENFDTLLASGEALLTLDDQKHILVELPQAGELPQWEYTLFSLQTRGYKPILAHPERYRYISGDFGRLQRLREGGLCLQVNLMSFVGYYGQGPEKMAKELLKRKLLDFAGTDIHHERHLPPLKELSHSRMARSLAQYPWRNQELMHRASQAQTSPSLPLG